MLAENHQSLYKLNCLTYCYVPLSCGGLGRVFTSLTQWIHNFIVAWVTNLTQWICVALWYPLFTQVVTGNCSQTRCMWHSFTHWRSYTQTHMGPGPGKFLSALEIMWGQLTWTATTLLYIELCRIKLPMSLVYDFQLLCPSTSEQQNSYEPRCKLCCLKAGVKVYLVIARGDAHRVPR